MEDYHKVDAKTIQALQDIANKLRIDSIVATESAKSGHPTSCASIAELVSVLFFNEMRYLVANPKDASSDRFILSKGHAAPILYAAWAEAGLFPVEDLKNLRMITSDLEGHPTPRLSFIDVGTGSLGQGLSVANGMAYVGKYIDKASYRVYCLLGDGETAEGSVWEALNFASHYRLDNLCVIFDINRLGQSEPTSLQHNIEAYRNRIEAFGFNAITVSGHDIAEICKAFHSATTTKGKPTAIIAKTFKGRGFQGIEDQDNWHGKPLGSKSEQVIEQLQAEMKSTGPWNQMCRNVLRKIRVKEVDLNDIGLIPPPDDSEKLVATRESYGVALAKLAKTNKRIIALDADTKNSTFADKIKKETPNNFIECFIAEQNLVGVATGVGCRQRAIPFVSTFAAFFSRTFDQIRMGAISMANIKLVGSHCGVSIGEDGPSQMGLEDLALFRSIPGCTIFYPSDGVSCERAVELAANTPGICYIRTSRPATPNLYKSHTKFEVGKSFVLQQGKEDKVLVISAGVTLHEAMKASIDLEKQGINIRVMDLFTIKPIDKASIILHAKACDGKIITVEDHYPEGGIGEAVMSAVAEECGIQVKQLAVGEIPRSGPSSALLEKYGISATCIENAIKSFILSKE